MKNWRLKLLSLIIATTSMFTLSSCDESYTTTEMDNLITELQTTIDCNKSELDQKITALTEEYKAKDNELLGQITANQQAISAMQIEYNAKIAELSQVEEDNAKAIADLTTAYNAKVEELAQADSDNAKTLAELKATYENKVVALEKADNDNKKLIEDLTTEYTEKIKELENSIATANATIESNKEELNSAIFVLTATYETKMAEVDDLLETLQNTDTTQDEKIAELANKITTLEQATRITDIEFTDNGDLLITFGDGSTQIVKAPGQHVHNFGEWMAFSSEEIYCENSCFFRMCLDCNYVEGKHGSENDHAWAIETISPTCQSQGYDIKTCGICKKVENVNYTEKLEHSLKEEYNYNSSEHWIICNECGEQQDIEAHLFNEEGKCVVCNNGEIGAIYKINSNGEACVVGCNYSVSVIADEYMGIAVTTIAENAFAVNRSFSRIVIGSNIKVIEGGAFYSTSVKEVFYKGTAEDWAKISIWNNSQLTSATRYYYSEEEPELNASGTAYNGNYWKYDADGKIVIWEYVKN